MSRANPWLNVAILALAAGVVMAAPGGAVKLADAEIFFEINDTDGDAGIQVFIDGEGWDTMQMTGPNGVEFSVAAENGIGMQGLTEFFFESAEPSFEVQPLEDLLALFPAGKYKFVGTTTEDRKIRGKARLTHRLPAAPVFIFPLDGDEVDPDDAVFEWQAVADPPGSEIDSYIVVVNCEEPGSEMAVEIPADVTQITVPPEVLDGQEECKWEILVVEESGNRTITEGEFDVE